MDTTVAGTAISSLVRDQLTARILPMTERTTVAVSCWRPVREAPFLPVSEIE